VGLVSAASRRSAAGPLLLSFVIAAVVSAHALQSAPRNGLVELLVWDATSPIDVTALAEDVRDQVGTLQQRARAYRSSRVRSDEGAMVMVYETQVRYERRLFAVIDVPDAAARAAKYVDDLRPCYEWEGYHDCPEREAQFATDYRRDHAGDPLNDYLALLAAHRWVCTAEGYDYEKRPADAARSRRAFEQALAAARQAQSPLIRSAASELARRPSCW
jgi:hypothetical protein